MTPELIDRVRHGNWNPDENATDKKHHDALAASGYWEAHNLVKETITSLSAEDITAGKLRADLSGWYRALFGPMVQAGMLNPVDLAGYRNRLVFIRYSRHTPLPAEALLDAMDTLFEHIEKEPHPVVGAILAHFFVGYIHPFLDGNGRAARFLMNALLVVAGYPWTIVRLETRSEYMSALESLSIDRNPEPFVSFILAAIDCDWQD